MSQLSPNNMQLFCRICLGALKPSVETIYNIQLVPKLTELLLMCTTLDIDKDADFYPKNMCQLCYEKLQDFQSYRSTALRSNQVLQGITREKKNCSEERKAEAEEDIDSKKHLKKKQKPDENGDDPLALRSKQELHGVTHERSGGCEEREPIVEIEVESRKHLKINLKPEENEDDPLALRTIREFRGNTREKNIEKKRAIAEREQESQNHLKKKQNSEENTEYPLTLRSKRVLRGNTREKNNRLGKRKAIAWRDDEQNDNQLLIPELSPDFGKKSIKTESKDFVKKGKEENLTDKIRTRSSKEIKNEIGSEDEENTAFYENSALGTNYHSTDDESVEGKDKRKKRKNSSIQHTTSSTRTKRRSYRKKKSLRCKHCDKQFYKQVYLDAHLRAVHEGHEKPFHCKQCSKSFTRYKQLHDHLKAVHLKSHKFACDFEGCEAVFNLQSTLKTHRKVVHLTDPTLPYSHDLQELLEQHQAELNKEIEIEHICPQCIKKFSSKRALGEHLKRHANIKEHVCKECGVAKVTRTELQTHMRTHGPRTDKFKCNLCPQEFNHKNAIQRHVRAVHEGLRPFPCSYCPKRFGTRNSKVCHERLHTGERPYVCKICRKGFAQSEGLKSHMKNHDKSLRTHVCKYCSRRFITRKNLIDHEARHQGDKPHICEICSRGFFQREDLLLHRQSHVDENGDFNNDTADNESS